MKRIITLGCFLLLFICSHNARPNRWKLMDSRAIRWQVDDNIPHYDHIEMSGEQMAVVLRYGVNTDGAFKLERSLIWPMLRTIPNNTHGSLMQRNATDFVPALVVDGLTLSNEKVKWLDLDGRLSVMSHFSIGQNFEEAIENQPKVELIRTIFPSMKQAMLCERYTLKNISNTPISINIPKQRSEYSTAEDRGVDGVYSIVTKTSGYLGLIELQPQQEITFDVTIEAFKASDSESIVGIESEEKTRIAFIDEVSSKLRFHSPDSILNRTFNFAKIRASESIFKTSDGYMHAPGGESYYAAVWANDQAEYVNPFFPFLGYDVGNKSALNSFRHFARFMNSDYKPIPSSIIAEGKFFWNGAGDRGDAAMIAYGAARYALERADRIEAEELWTLIEWCLEFCKRKITSDGVVASDSDELEGRFPSGKANLFTSCLYYDALISSSYLAESLGKRKKVGDTYRKEADEMKKAINDYFGAKVEGYNTYQYYEGNDILRSWICVPLTMGIYEYKEGTIEALFSDHLWTDNGLLTEAGTSTFWDRSTLYALRGVFAAGKREKAMQYLKSYSTKRLLGEHVPYPVEAWPEGSQRHLSAESGLYCRIITEGVFGIRPIGFNSFTLTPQLPNDWEYMSLNNIQAFSTAPFDIHIVRNKNKLNVSIIRNGKLIQKFNMINGSTLKIKL